MKATAALVLFLILLAGCTSTQSGDFRAITWEEATILFRYDLVATAFQAHNLRVVLITKDGKKYLVQEPTVDAVLHLIQAVDPKRERIKYGTE